MFKIVIVTLEYVLKNSRDSVDHVVLMPRMVAHAIH
jgi:hypothetical protein